MRARTAAAHAIKIDLRFSDPPRVLQQLSVCVRARNFARDRLDLRREHRVRQNRNVQAVP